MSISGSLDSIMEAYVEDDSVSPSRVVVYTRKTDGIPLDIKAFVGMSNFSQEQKDKMENFQSFAGMKLGFIPHSDDTITYGGEIWGVSSPKLNGTLWGVIGEKTRKRGR